MLVLLFCLPPRFWQPRRVWLLPLVRGGRSLVCASSAFARVCFRLGVRCSTRLWRVFARVCFLGVRQSSESPLWDLPSSFSKVEKAARRPPRRARLYRFRGVENTILKSAQSQSLIISSRAQQPHPAALKCKAAKSSSHLVASSVIFISPVKSSCVTTRIFNDCNLSLSS